MVEREKREENEKGKQRNGSMCDNMQFIYVIMCLLMQT